MALTGAFLVLFVTFHVLMNGVALFWPQAYNLICEFLGANWYALIGTVILAAGFVLHIFYAVWLTVQNRRARGNSRYMVTSTPKQVEWSSKNMLVLGIVILAFLIVHLIQFWAKMQLVEIAELPNADGINPADGWSFIMLAFSCWWTPVIYIIGFIALWFHMNHGFWSMLQTVGWNNDVWMKRVKTIACWWTSIVVLLFIAQAVVFTIKAHCPECNPMLNGCDKCMIIDETACDGGECADITKMQCCDNAGECTDITEMQCCGDACAACQAECEGCADCATCCPDGCDKCADCVTPCDNCPNADNNNN